MQRSVVCGLLLAALCVAVVGIGGCATGATASAELGMTSLETTPVAFPSVETTECPELLACVERADAPLPVVRTTSSTSGSSSSASSSDQQTFLEAKRNELNDLLATTPITAPPLDVTQ